MLALTDIRSWLESLGVSGAEDVYIGKLDDSKQQVIGVYGRPSSACLLLPLAVLPVPLMPPAKSQFCCIGTGQNRSQRRQLLSYAKNCYTKQKTRA